MTGEIRDRGGAGAPEPGPEVPPEPELGAEPAWGTAQERAPEPEREPEPEVEQPTEPEWGTAPDWASSEWAGDPSDDVEAPPGAGIFRRISPSSGSGAAGVFSVLETFFAPGAGDAREELQRQKRAGARNPSNPDPPGDGPVPPEGRVVAPGRSGTRFSRIVVMRDPAGGSPADGAADGAADGTADGTAGRSRQEP